MRHASSMGNIRIAQAGAISKNDISFDSEFGSHSNEAKFFAYV